MRSIIGLLLAAGIVFPAPGQETAQAAPAFTTKYSYYSVSGANPTGIFASLLRHLRRVNGRRHHAITLIDLSEPRTIKSAKGCYIDKLSVRFRIELPRHANEASLSENDHRLWQQFSSFVRKHEETHRAIWIGCARRIEARLAGLQGQSCGEVASKAQRVSEQIRAACRREDVAFDAAEQRRFDNHPFMKAALAPIYKPLKPKTTKLPAKKHRKSVALPN